MGICRLCSCAQAFLPPNTHQFLFLPHYHHFFICFFMRSSGLATKKSPSTIILLLFKPSLNFVPFLKMLFVLFSLFITSVFMVSSTTFPFVPTLEEFLDSTTSHNSPIISC